MRTTKYLIAFLLMALAGSSCLNDKGNYNYSKTEVIAVEGLKSSYTILSRGEHNLEIPITVTTSLDDAELIYAWSVIEKNVSGYVPKKIEIATTEDLDYKVELDAKAWDLALEVTNEKTGYTVKYLTELNVVTEYTRGWYVLKDDGVNSDLDMFPVSDTYIVKDDPKENLFMKVNERNLKGKAVKLGYLTKYKIMSPSGLYVNTKTLFATAENDIFAASISDLVILNDYSSIMYSPKPDPKLMGIIGGSTKQYLLSNGKIHSISASSSNLGKFGFEKQFDDKGSDYQLSPYLSIISYENVVLFDNLSSSFVKCTIDPILVNQSEDPTSQLPIRNNNHTCLYMEFSKSVYDPATYNSDYYAYGVFEEKDTKERMIGYILMDDSKFKVSKTPIKPTDKANIAKLFTISKNEDVMYFAAEGKVYSRNLVTNLEKVEYEVPAGEEIVLLRHLENRLYPSTSEDEKPYCHNLIAVGTNCGGEYKIRMFEKVAGSFDPKTPLFEMKGKGNLGDIRYVSPGMVLSDEKNYY